MLKIQRLRERPEPFLPYRQYQFMTGVLQVNSKNTLRLHLILGWLRIAAGLLGNPVGNCRKPFCTLTAEGMEQLKKTLELCKENGLH